MPGLLKLLPPPPANKNGWPWTVETNCQIFDGMRDLPKISIVTPSYNQGEFLEETIRSVLLQNYANTELIIIDGGSTDSTLEVIKKYEPWIAYWVSEKDRGQSHAINKGFAVASGDWIGWQNSDDIYLENAFQGIALENKEGRADVLFGHTNVIDVNSKTTRTLYYAPFSFFELKYHGMNIANQSAFFSRRILKNCEVSELYRYSMDAELFFRLAESGCNFKLINAVLGAFRIHEDSKSGQFGDSVGVSESIALRKKYGVTQTSQPWNQQYRFRKTYCRLRKLFYLTIHGNIWKLLENRR